MSAVQNIYSQCRTLDYTILLKARSDSSLVVKIFTISQERIFKKIFTSEQTAISPLKLTLTEFGPTYVVGKLFERELLTSADLPQHNSKVSMAECLEEAQRLVAILKPQCLAEASADNTFCCPITMTLFVNPVIDDHGHTFEKEDIEKQIKIKNSCPLNRQPIKSLTPNLLVRQTIDEALAKDVIPLFPRVVKSNPRLAESNLSLARSLEEAGQFESALQAYKDAFKYTNASADYAPLPALFEKLQQPNRALLASVFLAIYQINENKISSAIETLELASKTHTESIPLTILFVKLLEMSGQRDRAYFYAFQQIKKFPQKYPEGGLRLFRMALSLSPDDKEIYSYLYYISDLSKEEKAHLLLREASNALEQRDYERAAKFCSLAEPIQQESFVDHLIRNELMRYTGEAQILFERLFKLYMYYKGKNLQIALKICKLIIETNCSNIDLKKKAYTTIIQIYLFNQGSKIFQAIIKMADWGQRRVAFLVQNRLWEEAEVLAKMVLTYYQPLSIYENLEVVYTHWQNHKLCDLYTELGRVQLRKKHVAAAEQTYRKAYERFHVLDHILALADILENEGKIEESREAYYEATAAALVECRLEVLARCEFQILKSAPTMDTLEPHYKAFLVMQRELSQLQRALIDADNRLEGVNQQINEATSLVDPTSLSVWRSDYTVKTLEHRFGEIIDVIALNDESIACCSSGHDIIIWNPGSNNFTTLQGHTAPVRTLIERKDGTLASCSYDGTIKIWAPSGFCFLTLPGHASAVTCLIELKDEVLASGSTDQTIKLGNNLGACLKTFKGHQDAIICLAELYNGAIASADHAGVLKIWDRNGSLIQSVQEHSGAIHKLVVLKDGTLVSCSCDGTIKFWNGKGVCFKTLAGHQSHVDSLVELRDGTLVSGSRDTTIKLWNREGNCINTLIGHKGEIHKLIELNNGTFASASADKTVKIWDLNGVCLKTFEGHQGPVVALAELKDGTLVSGSTDKTVKLWSYDSQRKRPVQQLFEIARTPLRNWGVMPTVHKIKSGTTTTMIALRDGTFAQATTEHKIEIWNSQGVCLKIFVSGNQKRIQSLVELGDGTLVSYHSGGNIMFWNKDGHCLADIGDGEHNIGYPVGLQDGTIAIPNGKNIRIWNREGVCIRTLEGHQNNPLVVIELRDGILASGSLDKTIKLWNQEGVCIKTFEVYHPSVSGLIELQDGNLASYSIKSNTIKLWSREGICLKTIEGHAHPIRKILQVSNGNLISADNKGAIKLWDTHGSDLKTLMEKGECTGFLQLRDGTLLGWSDKLVNFWDQNGICLNAIEERDRVSEFIELNNGVLVGKFGYVNDSIVFWEFPKTT